MYDFPGKIVDRMLLAEASVGFHPISFAAPTPLHDARRLAKRVFDIVFSVAALAISVPLCLAIALAIRAETRGPILFRQRRLGLDGQSFEILKFRTMRHDRHDTALAQATRGDPRVTRVGEFLRRTSLDEIPQFLNILRGDMSVVGPRPHAPGTKAGGRLFEDVASRYADRHRVKPGLTGLAQVRGWRGETDTELKLLRRVESDLEYIETWSLWLDLRIVFRTVPALLGQRNAW